MRVIRKDPATASIAMKPMKHNDASTSSDSRILKNIDASTSSNSTYTADPVEPQPRKSSSSSSSSSSKTKTKNNVAAQTRKSIKKYFPLGAIMSKGNNNPITLHSVDEEVFPRLWSLLAETMVVEVELTRSTKEAIALRVSQKNQCPMCVTAHRMIGTAAKRAESSMAKKRGIDPQRALELHSAALDYAEEVIEATIFRLNGNDMAASHRIPEIPEDDGILNAHAKAEVALIVLLYSHLNRVISAVLGEQMSTAMFSVPEGPAKAMESNRVMSVVNKIMAPILAGGMKKTHKPGISSNLFSTGATILDYLPEHLQGVEMAGEHRALAVARLLSWVNSFEQLNFKGVVTDDVLNMLEDPANAPPPRMMLHKIAHWATTTMRKKIMGLKDETDQDVAMVLLLVAYSPQSVYNSTHWASLVKKIDINQAKAMVVWWSLKISLERSRGLGVVKAGM